MRVVIFRTIKTGDTLLVGQKTQHKINTKDKNVKGWTI